MRNKVTDVNHAARIVQSVVINRHAGVTRLLEQHHQLTQGGAEIDCLNIGTRHHDILDPHFAQPKNVVQHGPLFRREGSAGAFRCQRICQVLAQAVFIGAAEETQNPSPQGLTVSVAVFDWNGEVLTSGVLAGVAIRRIGRCGRCRGGAAVLVHLKSNRIGVRIGIR